MRPSSSAGSPQSPQDPDPDSRGKVVDKAAAIGTPLSRATSVPAGRPGSSVVSAGKTLAKDCQGMVPRITCEHSTLVCDPRSPHHRRSAAGCGEFPDTKEYSCTA